ncbi:hypothetical protein CCHOA_10870 [Corynebacterium choanae]|uniref:Uncharacterized protein n=2 Tax=Corynebacterium choanae TaxID=1862358 RepID=A0A3G6J9T7_9CORY|nr:hypothetical protein CCHOA_10870 [Corynebacterium choanae]
MLAQDAAHVIAAAGWVTRTAAATQQWRGCNCIVVEQGIDDFSVRSVDPTLPIIGITRTLPDRTGSDPRALAGVGSLDETILRQHPASEGYLGYGAFPPQIIALPEQGGILLRLLRELQQQLGSWQPVQPGIVIGVVGAVGGAGATVTAGILARLVADSVLFLDCNARPGEADLLFGMETHTQAYWGDVQPHGGMIDSRELLAALPATSDGIHILGAPAYPLDAPANQQMLNTPRWRYLREFAHSGRNTDCVSVISSVAGEGHTVICDIGNVTTLGDPVLEHCDAVVVLIPPEIRAATISTTVLRYLSAIEMPTAVYARPRGWSTVDESTFRTIAGNGYLGVIPEIASLHRAIETSGLPRHLPKAVTAPLQQFLDLL